MRHPDDHYDHFSAGWSLLLVVVAGLILLWVFAAAGTSSTTTHTAEHEFARFKRTDCVTGEQLDRELGICVPQTRYPIQAEPLIMDETTTPCSSFFQHSCG